MTEQANGVDETRFKQGLTYDEYIAQINVNQDRFQEYYESARASLTAEDVEAFKKAVEDGCSRVLVLGEDWCPDVYRGMPVIASISEASGMEMRVFPRDANLDIMDQFLKNGEHRSIPTLVFYTSDQTYVNQWIERPALATEQMGQITQDVEREMSGQSEESIRDARRERINAKFPDWQKETVRELRELIG